MPLGNIRGPYVKIDGKVYPVRNGLMERVWEFALDINKFKTYLYIRGTEQEVVEYVESELNYNYHYHAIDEDDVWEIKKLRQKIYIAPQIDEDDNY